MNTFLNSILDRTMGVAARRDELVKRSVTTITKEKVKEEEEEKEKEELKQELKQGVKQRTAHWGSEDKKVVVVEEEEEGKRGASHKEEQEDKKKEKKKEEEGDAVPFCCEPSVCSIPSAPDVAVPWEEEEESDAEGEAQPPPPPRWLLKERDRFLTLCDDRRRLLLRMRHCPGWRTAHAACGCPRQRKNQWRSWDLHTHFCPVMGVGAFCREMVREDMRHLESLFTAHRTEMNESQWPSAYDLLCKRARPQPPLEKEAKVEEEEEEAEEETSLASSSPSSTSTYGLGHSLTSSSSSASSAPAAPTPPSGDTSAESVARGIVFDLLAGLREAASDQSSGSWGDKGDYDERDVLAWEDKDAVTKEPSVERDALSDDVVQVRFLPEDKVPEGAEYYGPGPDGTRARPDPPMPGAPFDAAKGDEVLTLEF